MGLRFPLIVCFRCASTGACLCVPKVAGNICLMLRIKTKKISKGRNIMLDWHCERGAVLNSRQVLKYQLALHGLTHGITASSSVSLLRVTRMRRSGLDECIGTSGKLTLLEFRMLPQRWRDPKGNANQRRPLAFASSHSSKNTYDSGPGSHLSISFEFQAALRRGNHTPSEAATTPLQKA